ncbi:hypothetical protein BY458DRAFT_513173 [Sporodiniella umbellata]|nr:hypothetical protein BY458DRAFT_513173 [Sporodiniella umbellata]
MRTTKQLSTDGKITKSSSSTSSFHSSSSHSSSSSSLALNAALFAIASSSAFIFSIIFSWANTCVRLISSASRTAVLRCASFSNALLFFKLAISASFV